MSTNKTGKDIQHRPQKALKRDRNHKNYKEAEKTKKNTVFTAQTIR